MTKDCGKWKDPLLEAALTGTVSRDLEAHLQSCKDCATELRELQACRERQDALLPLLVKGVQPSAGFRARVIAAAEAAGKDNRVPHWRAWTLAGAMVTAVTLLVVVSVWQRESARRAQMEELAAAQKLAEWRAPSDALLATPGREMLRTTPKLGSSYLHVPVDKVEEE